MEKSEAQLEAPNDFRILLQQEFVKRCRKNPKYSLRAFARSLGIEASPLSAILRGKRPLTKKTQKKLGLALGLSLNELERFKNATDTVAVNYQQLTLDNYALISDWYHYAILELTRIESFRPDLKYIAKTLNISQTEAHIAVERLQRLGLLETSEDGNWLDTTPNSYATNINGDLTSPASKKLQRQVLEMSLNALEDLPTEVRNHTSMTMAIDPADLPVAKEMIKKFRRELCVFLERNQNPKSVYQLAVSLYPLTKQEN